MLLMIDNFDSFTYNLTQYLAELGAQVKVVRNNEVELSQIAQMQPTALVISPGHVRQLRRVYALRRSLILAVSFPS